MGSLKESASVLEFGPNISRCHQAKVANADKAVGEHMEEEPADKLPGSQADKPVGSRVLVIPGTEGNGLPIKGQEPLIGEGYPVGVMAQVAEDMPGCHQLPHGNPRRPSGGVREPLRIRACELPLVP